MRGSNVSGPASQEGPRERVHAGRPVVIVSIHRDTWELQELIKTLGLQPVLEVWQNRNRPHPGTFLGRGRLEELRGWLDEWRAGIRPAAWRWAGTHWVGAGDSGKEDAPGKDDGAEGNATTSWGGWHPERPGDPGPAGTEPDQFDRELLAIIDDDVRPAVLFNLEERLGVEVWGRTRLILEIFSQHAHLREARLQVELAQLRYDVPMVHEAVHRKRRGERPGFMGGGEYEVADYEAFIKRRMRTIRDELARVRHDRARRRKVRRDRFYLVSLAGYTNAGKSSLLSSLTGADAVREAALFSTLGTMTRRLSLYPGGGGDAGGTGAAGKSLGGRTEADGGPGGAAGTHTAGDEVAARAADGAADEGTTGTGLGPGPEAVAAGSPADPGSPGSPGGPLVSYRRPILVTDTVGFIRALPSWLVEAFHATLEEIALADVVLLVADASDPLEVLVDKVQVGLAELAHLDVTCPVLLVLNKIDRVEPGELEMKRRTLGDRTMVRTENITLVSAATGEGLGPLVGLLQRNLPGMIGYRATFPGHGPGRSLLSRLYGWGEVLDVDYHNGISARGLCDPIYWKDLQREAQKAKATVKREA